MLDRATHARRNWEHETLRSFVETSAWVYISMSLHLHYGDARVSAPLGALCGFGVVALGDTLTMLLGKAAPSLVSHGSASASSPLGDLHAAELALFALALVIGVVLRTQRVAPQLGLALLEPLAAGALLCALSQVLKACAPTSTVGKIVHNRVVHCGDNWRRHTIRSCLETSVWLATTFWANNSSSLSSALSGAGVGSYGAVIPAACLGAVAGLAVSVVGQLVFSHVELGDDFVVAWKAPHPRHPAPRDATTLREDHGVTTSAPVYPRVPTSKFPNYPQVPLPRFTMAQVAAHNTRDDCWIILDNRAYDITRFIGRHPGGVGPIVNMAGKDATDVFANYHAARVYKNMLPQYLVGEVTDVVVYPHVADFRAARQEMLRQGLFETDYTWYAKLGLWLTALFVSAVALSLHAELGLMAECMCTRMAGAALMGLFWQQLAGLGHDLGHSGVTHDFHLDHKIGSVLSAFMGLSVCWWKSDHNTHHVVCNAVEHDPNIQHMPMLAITKKIFEKGPFWDSYHKRTVAMDYIARALVSYQHLFFYPLMALGRFNLYAQGLIFLISKPDTMHYQKTELAGLAVFFAWLSALVYAMPSWQVGLGWLLVSHAVAGVLHVQIVLSHWSMETYTGTPYTSKETEWYLMQLRTTMNVATPEWLDFVHIGLQFQIEHHLYPRLPRHNLRKARKMVKAIAAKHGIHYHEPGFFAGNVEMWKALKVAAMDARATKKGDGGFYQSALWEGLNLSG